MAAERPDHILQTTALINEAYLRLIDWKNVEWQSRAHFFGLAAQMMRHILVDFARARGSREARRRRAQSLSIVNSQHQHRAERRSCALDDALHGLEKLDPTGPRGGDCATSQG